MRAAVALAFSFALLIYFSGCMEALFPYGVPGAGSNPKEAANNPNAEIPKPVSQQGNDSAPSQPPPAAGPANPSPAQPGATPSSGSSAEVIDTNASSEGNAAQVPNLTANQSNGSVSITITKLNETNFTSNQTPPAYSKNDGDYPLELLFFNVGFGDAALIRRGPFAMLVDAGSANSSAALAENLSSTGTRKLDIFALTSWDDAEAGGVPKVLSKTPVTLTWHNGVPPDTQTANATTDFFKKVKMPQETPEAGANFTFGDITLEFYLPQAQKSTGNQNLNTLAFIVRRGNFCAFFAGQMEQESEPYALSLITNSSGCQVLKMPNHGAGRPTASILTDHLSPEHAIVSVGQNDYNLPSPTTIERLRLSGTKVWRTDVDGAIYVEAWPSGNYSVSKANITAIRAYYDSEFPPG